MSCSSTRVSPKSQATMSISATKRLPVVATIVPAKIDGALHAADVRAQAIATPAGDRSRLARSSTCPRPARGRARCVLLSGCDEREGHSALEISGVPEQHFGGTSVVEVSGRLSWSRAQGQVIPESLRTTYPLGAHMATTGVRAGSPSLGHRRSLTDLRNVRSANVVKSCASDHVSRAATPGHVRGVGMVTAREAATCPARSCMTPSEPLTP